MWNNPVDAIRRNFMRTVFGDSCSDCGYLGFIWKLVLCGIFSRRLEEEKVILNEGYRGFPDLSEQAADWQRKQTKQGPGRSKHVAPHASAMLTLNMTHAKILCHFDADACRPTFSERRHVTLLPTANEYSRRAAGDSVSFKQQAYLSSWKLPAGDAKRQFGRSA